MWSDKMFLPCNVIRLCKICKAETPLCNFAVTIAADVKIFALPFLCDLDPIDLFPAPLVAKICCYGGQAIRQSYIRVGYGFDGTAHDTKIEVR